MKHADVKYCMLNKNSLFPPDFLLSRKVAEMHHSKTFTSTNQKIWKVMLPARQRILKGSLETMFLFMCFFFSWSLLVEAKHHM